MAYRGRSNAQSSNQGRTNYAGGARSQQTTDSTSRKTSAPLPVYKVKIKNPEGSEFKYSTVGMVSKFEDSGNLVLSIRKDLITEMQANEGGWINGLQLFTADEKK